MRCYMYGVGWVGGWVRRTHSLSFFLLLHSYRLPSSKAGRRREEEEEEEEAEAEG